MPEIALVKELITDVSAPLMPGDEIEFSFTITNIGNVTLSGFSLTDDLAGVTINDTAPTSLMLAPDASVTVTGSYAVTVDDIEAGGLSNTATVTGNDPHGDEVENDSGTALDNDDSTLVDLIRNPQIALVKTILTAPTAPVAEGDVISYAFEIHNTGNVELRDIDLIDLVGGVTVTGSRTAPLAVGEVDADSFTGSYTLTQKDIDAGVFANRAEVSGNGTGPDGDEIPVSGASGTAVDNDTPTEFVIDPAPGLTIEKAADDSAVLSPVRVGDEITYTFTVTNTGNVTLTNVTVTDPLLGGGFTDNVIATLAPDIEATVSATYEVTQGDIDAGEVVNTALVSATHGPDDTPVSTDSNEVVIPLEQNSGIALVKTADPAEIDEPAVGDEITYTFTVTNTGNVTLHDVTITDPLLGGSFAGNVITTLAPDAEATVFATYPITQADIDDEGVTNQATVTGKTPQGDDVSDLSGHTNDDDKPTVVDLGHPELTLTLEVSDIIDHDGDGIVGEGDEIIYSFTVENTGKVTLHDVHIDPASLGLDLPGLSCTPVTTLAKNESVTLTCTGASHIITGADVTASKVDKSAEAEGATAAGTEVRSNKDTVSTPVRVGGLDLGKIAELSQVLVGDIVPWTITTEADPDGLPVTARLVDNLPPGFVYRDGSAQIDGVDVEPDATSPDLVFDAVSINPGGSVTVTFETLVTSSVQPGSHTNRAQLFSRVTGLPISPEASATVRVAVDGVFQCSTVLGRVFDDINQDGHMTESGGEAGLPNVRLVAPNGIAILTDEHGRYSVPCAALPDNVGSNFMLRLDERTLPTGFRLTTENPRVVRLTPGMITRLDFGATLSRLVRIDLAAHAFEDGAMRPELAEGLARMVAELGDMPVMLRITWLLGDETEADARRHMREVERELRRLWPGNGRYQLNVETVIERGAQ